VSSRDRCQRTLRTARYRARQRAGLACYTIEVGPGVLDLLVKLHWLGDHEVADAREVSKALSALLADAAKSM
jgi:hypothetical protein